MQALCGFPSWRLKRKKVREKRERERERERERDRERERERERKGGYVHASPDLLHTLKRALAFSDFF